MEVSRATYGLVFVSLCDAVNPPHFPIHHCSDFYCFFGTVVGIAACEFYDTASIEGKLSYNSLIPPALCHNTMLATKFSCFMLYRKVDRSVALLNHARAIARMHGSSSYLTVDLGRRFFGREVYHTTFFTGS